MNIKKFKIITKLSKSIIKKKINYNRVALANLNIIRSHDEYFDISNIYKKGLVGLIKNFPKYIVDNFNFLGNEVIKKTDIILISSLISKSHLNKKDFYLSHIIDEIHKNKLKYNIILRNYSGRKVKKKKLKNKIILSNNRNFFRDFLNFIILFFEILFIKINTRVNNQEEKDFINGLFSLKNFISSIHNLNEINQIKKIIKISKPKKIFFTYEGYSWERLLCYSAKEIDRNIKLYGFYFSIITKHQHFPFLKLGNNYDPDYILTNGKVAKNKFLLNNFSSKKTIIVGSNRHYHNKNNYKNKKKINCLILPDGFVKETIFLINFAINCLKKNKNIRFILRLHPSLNNQKTYFKKCINKKNIILSKSTFDEDIKRSKFAIYRSSGAIIQATAHGIVPLYIKKQYELTVDPLYQLKNQKPEINNEDDFVKFYFNLKNNNSFFDITKRKKIVKYSKNYYMKTNRPNIKKLIN